MTISPRQTSRSTMTHGSLFEGSFLRHDVGKPPLLGKLLTFWFTLKGTPPPFTARCGSIHPAAPWPGLSSSILHSRRAWLETCARGDRTPGGFLVETKRKQPVLGVPGSHMFRNAQRGHHKARSFDTGSEGTMGDDYLSCRHLRGAHLKLELEPWWTDLKRKPSNERRTSPIL